MTDLVSAPAPAPASALAARLSETLALPSIGVEHALGEATVRIRASEMIAAFTLLRDSPGLEFDTLIDLCGLDMSQYRDGTYEGARYVVVTHLLSVAQNQRVRVMVSCPDDDFPVIPSLIDLWPAAGWYEREAFDLFGIMFEGHPDLRRILTDYGFVGHPFRKDFPVSGYVEMRYDPEQKRVVYQPVSIEPREVVPRVIREDGYGVERG
jgi:NADH-quinone oxidoreductase subunit C